MVITLKNVCLALTILATGLSAGVFYTWNISVIPGIKMLSDKNYLEAMKALNRAILNPAFFVTFMGAIPLLLCSMFFQYKEGINLSFWFMVIATISYFGGVFGLTAFGNVPMNEHLEQIDLLTLDVHALHNTRQYFERPWNQYNTIRTIFALIAFASLVIALLLNETDPVKTE